MRDIYLGLGSNIGDKRAHIARAIGRIAELVTVRRVSSFYETAPVGFLDQDWFLNGVIELESEITACELAPLLLGLELEMGRRRDVSGGPRTIDIDILFHGSEVIDEQDLQIPHPRLHERLFVLAPLTELCPDFVHPILGIAVAKLTQKLAGKQQIRPLDE